ncbi:MAG: hypothetical protein L3J35_12490 [Bacteroidales bacterium]|nr:hypothetical protein [Bacteroidales bacterium]
MKNSKIPSALYIISAIFIIISAFSDYFGQISAGFILLIIIFKFFWREGTPPIIIAGVGFQWLSITIGYIYLSIADANMIDLLWRPDYSLENIDKTYWLSLLGLLFFALGLKLAIYNIKKRITPIKLLQNYNTTNVIIIYALFTVFSGIFFAFIRFKIPGIAQPVNILSYFKWSLLFIMLYLSIKKNEKLLLVSIILGFEVLTGFTGYFSEFKEILILLPVIYLTFNKIKGTKQILFITFFAVLLFNIGAVWSYVKGEYRMFLSGGERAQTVTVSKSEALDRLLELTTELTLETYKVGLESMVKRIFFLEYFSATVNYIPKQQSYMDGENWNNAIKHVLMPRILFSNKKAIDDSEQTMKLTGIQLAGTKQGTSISVGYMAQAYADYGSFYMMIAIFILGLITGLMYKYFVNYSKNPMWGYALIFPMYFLININGKNITKISGNLFMYFLVFYLIVRFILPRIDKFIRIK